MKVEKEYKDYSVDEIIETMFKTFFVNDNVLTPIQFIKDGVYEYGFGNKTDSALIKLIAFDIINIDNNRTISLTKEGFKVIQLGSWTDYLKYLDENRQTEIEVSKSSVRANKTSTRFAWISGVFIGLGLLFQILGYIQQKETIDMQREQADIEYKSLHKTLHDSLCPLLNPRQRRYSKHESSEYLLSIDTVSKKP